MSIAPLDIEIRTISLKNKKLTKSIFNQIETRDCFNKELDFKGDKYFGYIKEKEQRYLIWSVDGKLRKTNLSEYSKIIGTDLNFNYTNEDIKDFLVQHGVEHHSYDDDRGRYRIDFEEKGIEQFKVLAAKWSSFISQVMENQIFI